MNETAPKLSRKWLFIPVSVALIVILCLILLPTIMSSSWGKKRALGMAAAYIPGSMQVERWSLSWFGGQELSGLSYVDADAAIQVDAENLIVSQSLIALIMNRADMGTVTVVQPVVTYRLPGPVAAGPGTSTPPPASERTQAESDPPRPEDKKSSAQGPVKLPELTGTITVQNGVLALLADEQETPELLARDIDINIDISALPGDITYSLNLKSADNSGNISSKGVIAVRKAQSLLDSFQPNAELTIENWGIARVLGLAALYTAAPQGDGILTGKITVDGSSQDMIKVDGMAEMANLELSGGPLGDDQPFLEKSSVSFSLSTDLRSLEVSSLVLHSPLARGNLTAGMDERGAQQLTADLLVDLPVVAGQLPQTLNLQEGLQINAGVLSIGCEVNVLQGEKEFNAGGMVDGLAGLHDNKQIQLAEPFTFKLQGKYGKSGLNLDQFILNSSFLSGEGQGSFDDMQLAIEADLGAAIDEIAKFVALDEYSGNGTLVLSFNALRKDDATVDVSVQLGSEKLVLRKGKSIIIPDEPLELDAVSSLLLTSDFIFSGALNTRMDYQSSFGNGQIEAKTYDGATRQINSLVFDGKTDLNSLSVLLKNLDALPAELSLAGSTGARLAMDYSPERITISSFAAEVDNFVFGQGDKTYRDKRLVVGAKGTVDLEKRELYISPVDIVSATGKVSFAEFIIGDWNNPVGTLTSRAEALFSLSSVMAAANDWIKLPGDISTDADVAVNVMSDADSGAEHRFSLTADLDNFDLHRADHQPFSGDRASLQVAAAKPSKADRLTIDQFVITSPLLNFDTSGFLTTADSLDTEVSFKGDLAMDLDRLASFIRAFTDMDLEMAGKSARPFEIEIKASPEQREQWWLHTDFSGAFQADLIKLMGVELRSLEIPITMSEGQARAEIKGSANEGSLHLQPKLDLVNSPAVVSLPENSLVIDQMQVTKEMANKLLGRIHPLFMGATQMSGAISLNMEDFWYPLGRENLNDLKFSGVLDLHDTKIDSSLLLGSLLDVLKVEDTQLDLTDRQIRFVCEDGRITTNPLNTDLGDSTLIMSGSLGLDGTIDYLVQTEVTENLVGGDLYKYLEGTTINVPIGGTVSEPDISARTVQQTMTDLIKQAGQKKLQESAGSLLKKLF